MPEKSKPVPELRLIPIADIELLENNPRKISKKDFKALCDDIKNDPNFLLQRPPLINNINHPMVDNYNDGRFICYAGNQRVKAAKELGYTHLNCWVEKDVPKELQDARMLKDNLHRGIWDFEILKGFDASFLHQQGFAFGELSDLFTSKNQVKNDNFKIEEELPKAKGTKIKRGDIFQLGEHRLMCGASDETTDMETLMQDDEAKVVYCDPPYNIGLSYDKGVKPQTIKKRYTETVFSDNKKGSDYTTWLMDIVSDVKSVAKKDCHVFFWCDPKFIGIIQEAFRINGIVNKSVCFWVKNSFNPVTNMPFNRLVEPVVYGSIDKPKINDAYKSLNEILNPEITGRKIFESFMEIFDVWTVQRDHVNDYVHPTQKPVTLHEKPLKRCSFPGDIVVDLFGGSGSTLMACEQMGRKARLMELDPIFCQCIVNRWEAFTGKKAVKIS
jgi:DNA modification methylase